MERLKELSLRRCTSLGLAIDVVDVDALGEVIELIIEVLTSLT